MSNRRPRPFRAQAPTPPNGWSRRDFLGRAGVGLGAIALGPAFLAACSGGGGGSGSDAKSVAISNWTSYIAKDSNADFTKATKVDVDYSEDINSNNEYFAKIRPNLSRDQSIGRDGFVLTDWMANRVINQVKWTQPLVASALTNKANLRAALQHPAFDPQRKSSLPWQSGFTGIAYNTDATNGKEVNTIDDFLAVDGTKTVLDEMRDTVGLFMRSLGISTDDPTYTKAEPAFDKLQKAVSDGTINGKNGNEYVNDLSRGDLAAAFAWSGDVAQITLDNPKIKFAIPESGGMLWSDNFMIPKTSEKAKLASEWINWFYDPANAAPLTAYIQYVSPVDGVTEELTKMGGKAAKLVDNPLVNPTDDFLAQQAIFGVLSPAEEEKFDKRFSQIFGSA